MVNSHPSLRSTLPATLLCKQEKTDTDMNTTQLKCALARLVKLHTPPDQNLEHSIIAWDQLPPILARLNNHAAFYICNTAISTHCGRHWVVVHTPVIGPVEYFDPTGKGFKQGHLHPQDSTYRVNTLDIQPVSSVTCGWYCLQFCKRRMLGQSMTHACSEMKAGQVV